MSRWSRLVNAVRRTRVNDDIDAELEAHIADAIADGADPREARRSMGPMLQHRLASRDARVLTWLESLRTDAAFGLRTLRKTPVTSVAAILSLALAIGACTAAFRLVDALLLRPLPIADPDRLDVVLRTGIGWWDGQWRESDSFTYPMFQQMRAAVRTDARLLAVSYAARIDLTFADEQAMEKATRQFVSGDFFQSLGLGPALGRVLGAGDDVTPGGHPYAVLSHAYWTRRFAADPRVIGRTLRIGTTSYEIVGVVQAGFTGTEPGTFVDVYLPTMMNARSVVAPNAFWIRMLVRPSAGSSRASLASRIDAVFRTMEKERAKGFRNFPEHLRASYPQERIALRAAAAGVSDLQKTYRLALVVLSGLVGLVLLIACANVGNLLTARASSRGRELALRVSIGAGRRRLLQLLLVEGALMAGLATFVGWLFAWWATPLVLSLINPPGQPAQLAVPIDGRVLGFGAALAAATTCLYALVPAWRAATVTPSTVLRAGVDGRARSRTMQALVAAQVAFCVLVLIVSGLLIASYDRLSHLPTGYSSARLLTVEAVAAQPSLPTYWAQVAGRLRELPGVDTVAYSEWPLLSGEMSNDFVSINGAPPSDVLTYFLPVSPGWIDTMRIPLRQGRDLRDDDTAPGAALVNETFVTRYFDGVNPIGRTFEIAQSDGEAALSHRIVGVVGDARYNELRKPQVPVAYVPYPTRGVAGDLQPRSRAAFVIRSDGNDPALLAAAVRDAIPAARAEFRASTIRTQRDIEEAHTIRERLVAVLASFFAATALLLACVGLYGVLDHSVLQQRRAIGIRVAVGARPAVVVRHVLGSTALMVSVGAACGVGLGVLAEQYVKALLFEATTSQPSMWLLPLAVLFGVATAATLPAIRRALRIPAALLLRMQ